MGSSKETLKLIGRSVQPNNSREIGSTRKGRQSSGYPEVICWLRSEARPTAGSCAIAKTRFWIAGRNRSAKLRIDGALPDDGSLGLVRARAARPNPLGRADDTDPGARGAPIAVSTRCDSGRCPAGIRGASWLSCLASVRCRGRVDRAVIHRGSRATKEECEAQPRNRSGA